MARAKAKGPTFAQLEAQFRQKNFSPLYLFYGEEDFLIDRSIDSLIAQALDPGAKDFNLDVIHGGGTDAGTVRSTISQLPMMSDRRLVLVKEFDRLTPKDLLLPVVESPVPSTIAVFVSARPDFRMKVYRALESNGTVAEFRPLYESEIPSWIIARVGSQGKIISQEAAQLMRSCVGSSLREIQNEIEKLFIYVGSKTEIGVGDVTSVVGMSKQYNVFELQKVVGKKELGLSLEILDRMIDAGDSPLGMIVMLTRYFEKLWLLREMAAPDDQAIASALGVSPYFAREYRDAARNFSGSQIEDCFSALVQADEALKSSGNAKVTLTLMLYRIVNGAPVELGA